MVPKPKQQLAREHVVRARANLDVGDEAGALNALFYAAEAAVVSLAAHHGIDTRKDHWLKAKGADELHRLGHLPASAGPLLRELNQQRKDVWYEGDPVDFADRSLEDVADEVEKLVEAAENAGG